MNQFWSGNECEILTHSQQQPQAPALFVFCIKIKLCAKMMFSYFLRLQIVKFFVPGCTGWLRQMGLIVVTIKHWAFCIATTHFDWMGLKCCI